jgi:hypothetical protein
MNMPAIMLTVRGRSTPHLHSPSTGTLVTGGASEAAEGAVQLVQHDSDCRFANTISGQHVTFAVPEDTETTNNVNNQLSPLDSVASSSGMTVPCCSKSAISLQLMSRSGGGGVPCGARIIDIRDHDLLITRIQRAMWERYRVRREFCSVMVRYDNGDDDGLIVQ